jgi:DEAD/DEAH box helicase domain-containing protein
VLIATSAPLDQYIVRHPEFFLGASPEHARVDPDQLLILVDHIRCAAFELPFTDGERFGGENLAEILAYLEEEQVVHHEGNQWHWMADSYPANTVNLRGVADGNFVVIDTTDGRQEVIAEVDYASAAMTLYEGAIYLVQATPWQVEKLDWEGRKAFVRRTRADYYTDAIDYTKLKILDQFEAEHTPNGLCARGEVHLVRHVAGYKKIRYHTHENVGYGHVSLPDQEMHTTAVWWQLSAPMLRQAFSHPRQALDGFLGAAYAMHYVAALLTMSEPRDLGRAVGSSETTWSTTVDARGRGQTTVLLENGNEGESPRHFQPTAFLYDNYSGGIGLSTPLYDLRCELVWKARELVTACECVHGCPACIGPILAFDEQHDTTPKQAAMMVLSLLAGEQSVES